jgi:hypothetical protein
MKWPGTILVFSLFAAARAQTPDVVIRVDVNPHSKIDRDGVSAFRWYDSLGKHSTVGLSMILETGYTLFVTERIQRMPSDDEQLDEYYLEDEGSWRVGKQYLPFGRGMLLRESVQAIRGETNILLEGVPIVAAIYDGGPGRQRGGMARIGTWIGVSFAFGDHFGISGSSLAVVRDPDDAPGRGRGYQQALGLDFFKRIGLWRMNAEGVVLRGGETSVDEDKEVSDVAFTYQPNTRDSVTLGWSRDWSHKAEVLRVQGHLLINRGVWLEPIVRFRGGGFFDAGLSLRAKL